MFFCIGVLDKDGKALHNKHITYNYKLYVLFPTQHSTGSQINDSINKSFYLGF